ncbi:hypothetical protein HHI36_018344 [Cryptolaemus montrouzieri]|uniref:UDP-N-acetylglucosamine diphosphorylase n=1 Tax=Cryptolaemus montrouzieri TaxID=559131 RepID=A0ABD2NZV8_9CUCU
MTKREDCSVCSRLDEIKKTLEICNQTHLLQFYNDLSADERENYLELLKSTNFVAMNDLFQEALEVLEEQENLSGKIIEPVAVSDFGSALTCGQEKIQFYWNSGLEAISEGKVAALVLSGGQGTRLGLNIPKGMISIELPSGKTIFQVHIERIRKLQELAQKLTKKHGFVPLYILTSETTHKQIEEFLEENDYFEMGKKNIILFRQGMNPCFTLDGKIILSNKDSIAMAPDGTGGLYQAMENNGIFEDLQKRGVHYVYVYPADNIMAKVADPIFVGYCIESKTDCAAKVLKKHKAKQNVGNICKVDGFYNLVEYSEISDELASRTDDKGELLFQSGSICIHIFTVNFMKQMLAKKFRPHVAKKKVPFIDEKGYYVNHHRQML